MVPATKKINFGIFFKFRVLSVRPLPILGGGGSSIPNIQPTGTPEKNVLLLLLLSVYLVPVSVNLSPLLPPSCF